MEVLIKDCFLKEYRFKIDYIVSPKSFWRIFLEDKMPKIILYIDRSTNAVANIYSTELYGYFQKETRYFDNYIPIQYTPQNNYLWYFNYEDFEKNSVKHNQWFSYFQNEISLGKDIIVPSTVMAYQWNKHGVNFLKQLNIEKNYHLECVINIGRQDLFYEHFEPRFQDSFTITNFNSFKESIEKFHTVIEMYDKEIGKDNVKIVFDKSSLPWQIETASLDLIKLLNFPADYNEHLPPFITDFSTKQGRKLWKLFTDDLNFSFNDILHDLKGVIKQYETKCGWDKSFVSSYEDRLAIHNASIPLYKELEKRCSDDLSFLFEDVKKQESNFCENLNQQNYNDFIENIPKELSLTLNKKLDVYERILNEEQSSFAKLLKKRFSSKIEVSSKPKEKLSVLTLCYNQEQYIGKCIESVQAQKTVFPIKHIIVDHCSKDNSQKIIAEYVKKYDNIFPYFFNLREVGGVNVKTLFTLADTEYVSICDGDDYFDDPLKLQKQVDLLEQNPSYGMCFHPVHVFYDDGTNREHVFPGQTYLPRATKKPFYYLFDLTKTNFIQTNSVVYRWRFKDGLPDWFIPNLLPGDWYWHLLHAEIGKIGYIDEVMSTYRRHPGSLYFESSISTVANRVKNGMKELEFYETVNEHFKKKYESNFQGLANGIFVDFLEQYITTGDDSYLNDAVLKYPNFGKKFLQEVKITKTVR